MVFRINDDNGISYLFNLTSDDGIGKYYYVLNYNKALNKWTISKISNVLQHLENDTNFLNIEPDFSVVNTSLDNDINRYYQDYINGLTYCLITKVRDKEQKIDNNESVYFNSNNGKIYFKKNNNDVYNYMEDNFIDNFEKYNDSEKEIANSALIRYMIETIEKYNPDLIEYGDFKDKKKANSK